MNAPSIVVSPLMVGSRAVPEPLRMGLAAAIPRATASLGMVPASSNTAAITSTTVAATAVTPAAAGRMITAAIAPAIISAPVPHVGGSALGQKPG
jgi:hypothetical protein